MVVTNKTDITITVMTGETKMKDNLTAIDTIIGKTTSLKLEKKEMPHLMKGPKKMNLEPEMRIETKILKGPIYSTAGQTSEKPTMEIGNLEKTLVMHISNVNTDKDFRGIMSKTTAIHNN